MSIFQILTSSIGRKILMAITGLLLSFFMAFHLFGNLFLFVSEAAFNGYVEKLHKLGFLIRIAEFFLLAFVLSHAYSGILLWWKNRKAK
ncbi:succinate dehydrogenase, partial [Candidatus Marinimicrobia bacterium]|nr:succinate dehydrogenase [Candidatus Neomarinimicrobiota bacterium]